MPISSIWRVCVCAQARAQARVQAAMTPDPSRSTLMRCAACCVLRRSRCRRCHCARCTAAARYHRGRPACGALAFMIHGVCLPWPGDHAKQPGWCGRVANESTTARPRRPTAIPVTTAACPVLCRRVGRHPAWCIATTVTPRWSAKLWYETAAATSDAQLQSEVAGCSSCFVSHTHAHNEQPWRPPCPPRCCAAPLHANACAAATGSLYPHGLIGSGQRG